MTHDFKTAVIDIHGINLTWKEELPYGNKNIGKMAHLFAYTVIESETMNIFDEINENLFCTLTGINKRK